ncbi:MAG: potassium-transporting ATPase subunit KdpC [Planctomycetota bacterium]
MLSELRPAVVALIVLSVITGVLYPLAVTGVAQVAFTEQANGSLIRVGDRVVGSRWIGQSFDDPRYFWGRLSATSPAYNGAASSGSNYGPLNPALLDAARARIAQLELAGGTLAPIPIDLVTASGSGLDPHISPAAARFQVARVARARRMAESAVALLVERHVEGPDLGVLGEPRVNVVALNLALDAQR